MFNIDDVANVKADQIAEPSWLKKLKKTSEGTFSKEYADQFNRASHLLTKEAVPHIRLRNMSDLDLLINGFDHFMAEIGVSHCLEKEWDGIQVKYCGVEVLVLKEERPKSIVATLGKNTKGIRIDLIQRKNIYETIPFRSLTVVRENIDGCSIGPDLRTGDIDCDGLWEGTVLSYLEYMQKLYHSHQYIGWFIREASGLFREIDCFLSPKDLKSLLLAVTFGIPVDDKVVQKIIKDSCFSVEPLGDLPKNTSIIHK